MPKLLRKRKQFGRCSVQGHGQDVFCEVMDDIQTTPFTRAQEKIEVAAEIDLELEEMETPLFTDFLK
jgi:hypothetical protein